MIDLYPMLARAVRELPEPTAEARQAAFSRAVAALQSVQGLSDELASNFLAALHAAYVRLECEYLGLTLGEPAPLAA